MYTSKYPEEAVLRSLEAEAAKASGEVKCALGDLDKALARLRFILAGIHDLRERNKDETKPTNS